MPRTKVTGGYIADGAITSDHLHTTLDLSSKTLTIGAATVSGHLIPDTNITYDLGSSTYRFRDIYLDGNTIDLGGTELKKNSDGDIEFKSGSNFKRLVVSELEFDDGTNRKKFKISSGRIKSFDSSGASDTADKISLSSNTTDDLSEGSSNLYFTNERVDDRVNSLLTAGTGITLTYDDSANTLTIAGSAQYGDSDARSAISVSGNALSYNSTTGVITANYEESPTFTGTVTVSSTYPKISFVDTDNNPDFTIVGGSGQLGIYDETNATYRFQINSSGNITVSGTVDGRDIAADGTKLDGIESGATADQTQSDINALAITEVGTISSGTWQGTAIASAYLDSDTAHLSGTQTFSGAKTFSSDITSTGLIFSNGGDRSITGPLNEDLIINARPNDTLEGLHLQINGVDKLTIRQGGNAFFGGDISSGAITSTGAIEGASFSDGTISGITFIDEDSFATNSATRVPTQQSIKAYVDAQVAGVVDSAPAALNTLNELAAALGDDANFSTTTSTALGNRLRVDTASQGLTGTQQANAITNLGITATKAELNVLDGITATVTELNYTDGVTSNIQTQLNAKLTSSSGLNATNLTSGTVALARLPAVLSPSNATELGSGTDLDSLTASSAGFYYQTANADTPGNNYPNGHAGSLIVQKSAGQSTQLYQTYSSSEPRVYFRSNYTSGYGNWQRVFADNYHPNADKWTAAKTLTLGGDLTGNVSFDGSANFTLTAAVVDDSHNHIISNIDGLQTALDAKLASSSYTAADVLTKIKTVDGSGSGLDADLLDGKQPPTNWAATSQTYTTIASGAWDLPTGSSVFSKADSSGGPGDDGYWFVTGRRDVGGGYSGIYTPHNDGNFYVGYSLTDSNPTWYEVWTSGSDGPGSGLNADLLDGQHGSYYAPTASPTFTGTITNAGNLTTGANQHTMYTPHGNIQIGPMNTSYAHIYTDRSSFYFNKTALYASGNTMWHAGNDGAGSGLDADTLDGSQGAVYFKSPSDVSGWQNSSANFSVRGGSSSAVGLHMEQSDGDFGFQIYGDGSNYGFLDGEWANWDIKKTANGAFSVDEGAGLKRVLNEANWSSYVTSVSGTSGGLSGSPNITVGTINSGSITTSGEFRMDGNAYLRSNNVFAFLTVSGNAQVGKFKAVAAQTSYGNSASDGMFNALNGYAVGTGNGTTVIDSSRNLRNIPLQNLGSTQAGSEHAVINIGRVGGAGETRAIDIIGSWVGGESKSITAVHGSSSTQIVGQINFIHDSPGSRIRFGKLYESGDSSVYPMILDGSSTTGASLDVTNDQHSTGNANRNFGTAASRKKKGAFHVKGGQGGTNANAYVTGLTFTGADEDEAQAGLYCSQNSSTGTSLSLMCTNSYSNGPKEYFTVLDNGYCKVMANTLDVYNNVYANTKGSAYLVMGEDAYSVSGAYIGMKTSFQSGSSDYMIISGISDGDTYVSAKNNSGVQIRGGGNNSNNQISVPDGTTITATTTDFRCTGNVTAYASDARLKTNIQTIKNPIEKIKKIRGVEFDWLDNIENFNPKYKHETGVIAQEIEQVIPDAVDAAPFNEEYKTVDKEKIVALLIEAIKEQQKLIEKLTSRLNDLENKEE